MKTRWGITLALAVVVLAAFLGVQMNRMNAAMQESIRQTQSARDIESLQDQLREYHRILGNPESGRGVDFLMILDSKLASVNLSPAIKEIEPVNTVNAGEFHMEEIRVRMAPVTSDQLEMVMTAMEHVRPFFRITAWEFNRIHPGEDSLTVMLTLQHWVQF